MHWLTPPTIALALGIGWDPACGAAAERRHRKACGTAANSRGGLFTPLRWRRWRDKLRLYQEVFEGGGAVKDNSVVFCYY